MSTHQYILHEPAAATGARLLYVTHAQYSREWNSSLHTHACTELFFILGGRGSFQVRSRRFSVEADDLVVVNTGVPHTETSENGSPMEYVVLGAEGLEPWTGPEGCAWMRLLREQEAVRGCLRMMLQEAREGQEGAGEICQSLLEVILRHLLRRQDFGLSSPPARTKASQECALVRRYMDAHFKEHLTLDQLAGLVHISKYYLAHSFQKEFGISPIQYLTVRRVEESRFLLRETDHSLSRIAQIVGFSSPSYFSQSFRRTEGMGPLEYRKQCAAGLYESREIKNPG